MSSYIAPTRHPETGKIEQATWMGIMHFANREWGATELPAVHRIAYAEPLQ